MPNIAIAGAAGRMGQTLVQAVYDSSEDLRVSVATVLAGDPLLGQDVGLLALGKAIGVTSCTSLQQGADFDVLIDFTSPEATMGHLDYCQAQQKSLVIGTTGLDQGQLDAVNVAGQHIPVVFAPNMSLGVNVCFQLLEQAARLIGHDVDIEIVETHHRHKKDAPSGTALAMGEIVARVLGRKLQDCAVYGREGNTGERARETIGFATIRAGDVVGEHTVIFAAAGERIEITHKASSRMTFARGAVRAASWLQGKPPGVYSMQDVLVDS